jgi:hypothetical protein
MASRSAGPPEIPRAGSQVPAAAPDPPVEIVLQLTADALATGPSAALDRATAAARTTVRPLHPDSTHPDLVRMGFTSVPAHLADEVLQRLLDHPDVETAYVKPAGAPP